MLEPKNRLAYQFIELFGALILLV
uniref:Uncharacterized protein n=1 Tax=Rhizophora mucronata TaxID=61149 RepID=A0A2P2R3H9_RHIMU